MRQAAGITIETAARNLRWSMGTLSHIERGHTSNRKKITAYRDYLTGCAI